MTYFNCLCFTGGLKNCKHALSLEDIELLVCFILNFAEDHGIVLPGRIPGFKRDDVKVLPSNFTKAEIWRIYRNEPPTNMSGDHHAVGLSTFRKLWAQLVPYVFIAKSASDQYWVCQKNNIHILKNVSFFLYLIKLRLF